MELLLLRFTLLFSVVLFMYLPSVVLLMNFMLLYIGLQKPIGIIALLDEAWYNLSSSIQIGACYSIQYLLALYPYPDFLIFAACSQNQLMGHFQPNCFSISIPMHGWRRQNFQKQILQFPTMLERHVIYHRIFLDSYNLYNINNDPFLYILSCCRLLIIQIPFQIKIVIMLWQSIAICFLLPNTLLLLVFSLLCQKSPRDHHTSFLLWLQDLRYAIFFLSLVNLCSIPLNADFKCISFKNI